MSDEPAAKPADAPAPAAAPAPPKADPAATHVAMELKHGRPLVSCRFDPLGRFVFAGSQDNSVQRWELAGGKQTPLAAHESWVHALAFDPSGQTLLTGGCDGRLIWWPATADAPTPTRTVDAHAGWVRAVAVSPDGQLVATCGNDRLVKLWKLADGTLVREFVGHAKPVYSLLFHPGGQFLLAGDLGGAVKQWDVSAGTQVREFDAKPLYSYNGGQGVDFGGVRGVSLSPDGKSLAAGGLHEASNPLGAVHEPLVIEFDWDTAKARISHTTKEKIKGVAWRTRFHPDGFLMAASGGTGGGFVIFWQPADANEFATFKLPNTALDMDLHPDGMRLATAHHDGHVRISLMQKKPA